MPLIVVIDTNFIAVPAQFGIDIFAEAERILERNLEFIILSPALAELERKISSASSKIEERHFRIARELIDRCKIFDASESTNTASVDDQILHYAKDVKGVLATNDRALRKKARKIGVPVLHLRGKKQLALDGSII